MQISCRLRLLLGIFVGAVSARRSEFGHQPVGIGARDVEPVFVDVRDLDEIPPLRGVEPHAVQPPQVDEVSVVAEEPASAEDRQKPFHAFGVHPAHRGDFVAAYFGDVQQTAHFDGLVRHDDLAGNRQRHQGHQRHDERGEPRREVTPFVQVVQQAAQQDEDDDVNQRPVDRAVIEAVFIRALHR